MSEQLAVSLRDVSISLGGQEIVHNVSFDVRQGEIFGLLGANGSGKTTTIRALLGMYQPTSGQLLIDGQSFSLEHGRRLGYLPEERGLYRKEKVLDTMVYFGQLKGLDRATARRWSMTYLERVDLGDKAGLRLDKLSGGQQQKVQLGVTLMNQPSLLILDEPTKGFDPVNRRLLLDLIEERRQAGATVILVTHQMDEVERLCSRMVLLKDGRRRAYGTLADIRAEFGRDDISLEDIFVHIYGHTHE